MKKNKVFAKNENRKLKNRLQQAEDKKVDFPDIDIWI